MPWVIFEGSEDANFIVADATTGRELANYADENVLGDFVCYNAKAEKFSFLTLNDQNQLNMATATAK